MWTTNQLPRQQWKYAFVTPCVRVVVFFRLHSVYIIQTGTTQAKNREEKRRREIKKNYVTSKIRGGSGEPGHRRWKHSWVLFVFPFSPVVSTFGMYVADI